MPARRSFFSEGGGLGFLVRSFPTQPEALTQLIDFQ